MKKEQNSNLSEDAEKKEETSEEAKTEVNTIEQLKQALSEATDKYVRLYADFENYKKAALKNKEELLKYANVDIMTDILTVIDHLELALQHTGDNKSSDSLAEGVELTLKELKNVLEKHGLKTIEALGKPFDPSVHHAMSKIESEDEEENSVVKEFRKGYLLKDRVIRAALVGVAIKPSQSNSSKPENNENHADTPNK